MNITVNSQTFATELRLLAKIVPSNPPLAILSHVLLRAEGNQLQLYATDLEVSLGTVCVANTEQPGTITLPAEKLLALVEQFPDGDVNLTLNSDKKVLIRCGAFRSRLQALPVDDFPPMPEREGETSTFDAAAFKVLIGRARHAVSAGSQKMILRGALLTAKGTAAAMVATDGKRLALATVASTGAEARVIIPAKALDALDWQLSSGQVEMTVGPRHLFFTIGSRLLTSRTIDGTFPQYERIIPRGNDKMITIDRAALQSALKRVVIVSERNQATCLDVSPGRLELTAKSAEVGAADEEVAVEYEGEPLKICVNGGYVLDFLDAASGDTITLSLKDANSPALFADGHDYVEVIMGLRP